MNGYKNFPLAKFWRAEINIGRILVIRYDLKSGQRDLSVDVVGFRVYDLKMRFRARVKDFNIGILGNKCSWVYVHP